MPKFTESEKQAIQETLLREGEKLFVEYGLKKVTVDELVKAAGIAKGSFYSFYSNKEHLYMDILNNCQREMRENMEQFLSENKSEMPTDLTKKIFFWMLESAQHYPLIEKTDEMTIAYLYRKLPPDLMEMHTLEDVEVFEKLEKMGVTFKCNLTIAAKACQVLFMSSLYLQKEDENVKESVMHILVNGLISEIVEVDTK